jgi:hypothetical protein
LLADVDTDALKTGSIRMLSKMKFKVMGSFMMAAAALGVTPSARASGGTGTVIDVIVENGTSFGRIRLSGAGITTGRPGCHNSAYTTHYGFDLSTSKGKALLSTATAALLAGKTVQAGGDGVNCTTVAPGLTIETLTYIILNA